MSTVLKKYARASRPANKRAPLRKGRKVVEREAKAEGDSFVNDDTPVSSGRRCRTRRCDR